MDGGGVFLQVDLFLFFGGLVDLFWSVTRVGEEALWQLSCRHACIG